MTSVDEVKAPKKRRFAYPVLYGLLGILVLGIVALIAWPKDGNAPINQSIAAAIPEANMTAETEEGDTKPLPAGTFVAWSAETYPQPVTFQSGDIRVTVTGKPGEDDTFAPELRINAPGMREHVLTGDPVQASITHRIGVGHLNPQARTNHVILASYGGGAHCCTSIQVAVPSGNGFTTADLGNWDNNGVDEFPKDVSGDGVADFNLVDNSFLYAFSSYADSYAPPVVYNLLGAKFVDVSKAPAFRKLFADFAEKAQQHCVSPSDDQATPNGACAGYVAAAARSGQFQDAWSEMLNGYDAAFEWPMPSGCKVKRTNAPCPEGQEIDYGSFPEALFHFLVDQGYIPAGTKLPAAPSVEPGEVE